MKIKKVEKYSSKLLKLQLLKTKTFSKKQYPQNISIEDIECRLKTALQILYKYNINNKRIAFVGTPHNISRDTAFLLKTTKHILIPELAWVNGILTNQTSSFKFLISNQKRINSKLSEALFKLKKRVDLVVILDKFTNTHALNESYDARIPVISLNNEIDLTDSKSVYKVPGNFKFTGKTSKNSLFFSVLLASLNSKFKLKKTYHVRKKKNKKAPL